MGVFINFLHKKVHFPSSKIPLAKAVQLKAKINYCHNCYILSNIIYHASLNYSTKVALV
jgi:hypothetical protein